MQRKPFWLINGKLCEADFFLDKLREAPSLDEARYYFSAFVSAARSVTYAIQATLNTVDGFNEWWQGKRIDFQENSFAKYLKKVRDELVHVGMNPLGIHRRGFSIPFSEFLLIGRDAPEENVSVVATEYMALLVMTSKEAFSRYWTFLDLSKSLTLASLHEKGKKLEDIEEELGLPCGWSNSNNRTSEERLDILKEYSQTDIDRLAAKYNGIFYN
jgi:hypothetical protein